MVNGFEMDAYRKGGELLVVLHGRLVMALCPEARTRLNNLLRPQINKVYLDLGALDFLDSAGLSLLVSFKMNANKRDTQLVLLAPPPAVSEIFRISKLDLIFEILTGIEAETTISSLQRDEFCLWRDGKDASQGQNCTEYNESSLFRANLTQVHTNGDATDETTRKIKQCCLDAADAIREGNYPKAIEIYQQALVIDHENLAALNNLAIVLEKRPEWYTQALEIWNRVLVVSTNCLDEKHASRAQKHIESLSKLVRLM